MRRFCVATAFAAVAACACGCGNGPAPERTATKVLRPEEAKISLGTKSASAVTPAEGETKAAPATPAAESKP